MSEDAHESGKPKRMTFPQLIQCYPPTPKPEVWRVLFRAPDADDFEDFRGHLIVEDRVGIEAKKNSIRRAKTLAMFGIRARVFRVPNLPEF